MTPVASSIAQPYTEKIIHSVFLQITLAFQAVARIGADYTLLDEPESRLSIQGYVHHLVHYGKGLFVGIRLLYAPTLMPSGQFPLPATMIPVGVAVANGVRPGSQQR